MVQPFLIVLLKVGSVVWACGAGGDDVGDTHPFGLAFVNIRLLFNSRLPFITFIILFDNPPSNPPLFRRSEWILSAPLTDRSSASVTAIWSR